MRAVAAVGALAAVAESVTRARWVRAGLLLPGGLALLVGLNAGLERIGVPPAVENGRVASSHGALMVLGFVGTVVALERAVALGRYWGFIAPALLGLGAVTTIAPAPVVVGRALMLAGALALLALYVPLYRRQRDTAVAIEMLGAALAAGGALLLVREVSFPVLLPWLAGFVVLTIVGERLELARIAVLATAAASLLVIIAGALCVGIALTIGMPVVGYPITGAATIALVAWLVRYDVATKTIRGTGLPRYIAACLLLGYCWLGVAGLIWLLSTSAPAGAAYDASVHAVFLGFTISMVMAHAPVILPAVLRRPLPYSAALYAPAVLLHLSLVIRLGLGDGLGLEHARALGAVLNAAAIVLFVLTGAAASILKGSSR